VALAVAILLAIFVVDGVWEPIVIAAGGAIEVLESYGWWRWSKSRRPAVGVEALIGRTVFVDDNGWARVAGERWQVRGAGPRESARIVGVDGLTLLVERE
jgi:membrane protein implicated in regulation of membrane protease activity